MVKRQKAGIGKAAVYVPLSNISLFIVSSFVFAKCFQLLRQSSR